MSTLIERLRDAARRAMPGIGRVLPRLGLALSRLAHDLAGLVVDLVRRARDWIAAGDEGAGPAWRRKRVWAAAAGGLATLGLLWLLTLGPAHLGAAQPVQVFIAPGTSTTQIGQQLAQAGLIRSRGIFRLWVQLTGRANGLRAGEYDLHAGMSIPAIAAKLARGEVKLYPVTIPEGLRFAEISELLVQKGFASAERLRAAATAVVAEGALPTAFAPANPRLVLEPLEGFLFPDTYMFYRGISETEMLRAMVTRFRATFTEDMIARCAVLGLTPNQAVSLAAIIEKEARLPEERPVISGVFHNRLKRGMALQTDPTVRYVMRDPDGPITSRELAIDSPYNTYVYPGLTPGPICSPGLAALNAALNPAATDFLYFVAKLDGSHAFAATLAEHNANVRRYLGY